MSSLLAQVHRQDAADHAFESVDTAPSHASLPEKTVKHAGLSSIESTRLSADAELDISRDSEPARDNTQGNVNGQPDKSLDNVPNNPDKPSGTAIVLTMASLCLSVTLSALDMTIVTTAIPAIVASLNSDSGYIWVGSAFILGYTSVTPVWGSVADIWGRKPIILTALSVFLAGSLLCALAPHMDTLIAGRAVQGVGASGMGVMVNTIICDLFSLRDRGLYLAVTSIIWAVGSAVGPVLGGVFSSRLSWRWCFWINLPIGVVVFGVLLIFLSVPSPSTPVLAGLKAVDWAGSLLCIGGALMVLLGLDFGDAVRPWSSTAVICLIIFGAVAVGVFIVNEWKFATNPIIPLRLLSTPSKAAAYVVLAFNSFVFIGITYYLPLYSQSVLSASPIQSGLYLLPLIVSCSLSAACAGIFIQRTGKYRPLMYVAQVLLVLGVGLFVNLDFEQSLVKLVVYEIITGIGTGLNIEAPIIAAQAATTTRDTSAVVATMGFLRSMATAISVVVGGVIFQNKMKAQNKALVSVLGLHTAAQFDGENATANILKIGKLQTSQQAPVREAYFRALRTVWIMYVAVAGFATLSNLLVSEYPLSSKREKAVLGINRDEHQVANHQVQATGTAMELIDQQPRHAQKRLRSRVD